MMSIVRGLIPGGWDYFAQDHNPWESRVTRNVWNVGSGGCVWGIM